MDSRYCFDLKRARIYKAVKWSRNPLFVLARPLRKIFLFLFAAALIFFLYGFLAQLFSQNSNSFLLGLTIIFWVLAVSFWVLNSFFNLKLKKPNVEKTPAQFLERPADYNLAELLSFGAAKAAAKTAASKKNDSAALLYFLLSTNKGLADFVFSRFLIDSREIRKRLKQSFSLSGGNNLLEQQLADSLEIAKERNHSRVEAGDILTVLAENDPIFQRILTENNLRPESVADLTRWFESLAHKAEESKKWWKYENLMKKGTLAKEWAAGYTINLDKYSIDWTEIAKKQKFPEIIGHEQEIEQVERILARHEYNNVLLVGEPGVGRKSVIHGLLRKSVFGESLPQVNYKRAIELNLPALLAEISNPEEVESALDVIFREVVSAGNIVLIINEFEDFIAVKPGPGKIDISGVISSYLHLPQFQVIAVAGYSGLHKNIEQNPSILNLFEKVEVPEMTEKETLIILENFSLRLEKRYNLFVSYPAIREIVSLCRRYLTSVPFPKKALDVLDEAMIYVKKTTKEKTVLPSHVSAVISQKTQVPVGDLETREKEILLNLENLIHQRIVNQEEAVSEVSAALRRARSEVNVKSAPMGTFLFLGPTGVGKTETSKALAKIYFGSESRMIRLDMSEFQATSDIARLIGSAGEEGLLTTAVRENPFSLVLLDEIEKAHSNILNLFLQVLDEGYITDGLGRKVDFRNTIIISTSNAGYQVILQALKEKADWSRLKEKLLDYLFDKGIFRPEFINRFDAAVVFKPLSKENLLDISELILSKLKKNLKQKGVDFVITMPLKERIVELGYDPTFGARQMKRVVQDKVENALASALLSGRLKRGDRAEIDPESFNLAINRL